MIDPVTFAAEMTILQNRFPGARNMPKEVIARYLDFLGERLTTQEFVTAAREIFNQDTFWPSPARFVEAVQGNPKQMADDAWATMLEHARKGTYPELATLPTPTRAALKAAPMREIMYATSDFELNRLKREFVDAHQRATGTTDTHALPEPVKPEPLTIEGFGS